MSDPDLTPADKLYRGAQLTRPLLRNITARVDADLAGTGVTVGQRAILEALLHADQATAPELTALLDMKRQFVARELKQLLRSGMVETRDNPRHRRSVFYRLTATSRATITAIRQREVARFTEFAKGFSKAEIDAYLRIQQALNDAFSRND